MADDQTFQQGYLSGQLDEDATSDETVGQWRSWQAWPCQEFGFNDYRTSYRL